MGEQESASEGAEVGFVGAVVVGVEVEGLGEVIWGNWVF